MQPPVALRRLFYRFAYQGLRLWWLVFHPEIRGVKCVLTQADRVLLVRHTYGPRGWDLPGGTARAQEDPADTARREIYEELGVLIEEWNDLGEIDNRMGGRRDKMHCFQAEVHDPLTIDLGELDAAQWFPPGQLPGNLNHYVRQILARAQAVA